MTNKEQFLKQVTSLNFHASEKQAIENAQKAWIATGNEVPFALPTRSELTIIDLDTFPMGELHKGTTLGYTRIMPRKTIAMGTATHYPQTAIDFGAKKGVKFLLGANDSKNEDVYFETVEATIFNKETNEREAYLIQGQQVYNLVTCKSDKYEKAQTGAGKATKPAKVK